MASAIPQSKTSHPCFYAGASAKHGRIHLPVARSCNIQCAYCRRDYDCPNENRPGVCTSVVSPEEACERLERFLEEMPHISVAAVAGPGDAFSDADRTLRTFELIRRKNRDIALCVSSNGLELKEHTGRLRELNVGYVTITVNAIDPRIGSRICRYVNIGGKIIGGIDAARILIERQLESISLLKSVGITVKVNSVVIPGVNDDHMLFLARQMGAMGVDLMNFVPLLPVAGTEMEGIPAPGAETMARLRQKAAPYVAQMHHCTRCRSDAAGLLKQRSGICQQHS